ncbi:TetR/AcrR family transcriptional regulator [Actinomadura sp. 21ATH]|uniref:TetR/AcrR family transcriptional regulator n=1 Tax=Actinomadura sp. 21ATH TaxID=1735444 RepID=UPI0035C0AF2E
MSVWMRQDRPRRGNPPLTRERIVEAAVAFLDEEGHERLTMRRLAERLGTGATTLYWHVDTKDDVLDLALDAIFGEARIPAGEAGWRDDVRALIGEWRAAMLRHPWSAALLDRPLLGPNVLARTEFMYATLVRAGFRGPRLTAAAAGLSNYVIGAALMEGGGHTRKAADTADAADRAAGELVRRRRDLYPNLAEHGHPGGEDREAAFEQGLTYLLDGMAPYVSGGGSPSRPGTA